MKIRILSAVVMFLIFVPVLLIGNAVFAVTCGIVGSFALYELINIKKNERDIPFLTKVLAYISTVYIIFSNYTSHAMIFSVDYRLICLLIFIFLIPTVVVANNKKYSFQDGLYLLGASLLVGFSFNLLILIRNYSLETLIYLFIITIITDTFALITGKCIGKHKLSPTISPNKTIEGLIGGTVMGVFVASIFYVTAIDPHVQIIQLLIVTTSLSLIGQLGDLAFSQIKRYYNVKDFSNFIPGHGGVLDRLDSIIFVVLMYTLFITII